MTVNVTKPAINVREKLAELDKPSGIAGEAMLRAETPQEQFNLIGAGRRNLIINGENKISQRGDYTSATAIADNTYYIDRWKAYENTVVATLTHKENQSLPDGSISHTQRYDVTSGATGYFGARQPIEEALMGGRIYTISAWVKSNNSDINLFSENGDYRKYHSGSGEWEKLSITFVATGLSAREYGIINYTSSPQPTATGDFVEFTQVQLELGKVATPFEHRSYGEELALCQRYYYKINSADNNSTYQRYAVVSVETSTSAEAFFQHPVTMRTNPTLDASAAANFHIFAANTTTVLSTDMFIDQSSPSTTGLALTVASGLTAGQVGLLNSNNNNTSYIAFNAEL